MLQGRKIILGVSGSIAAFKSALLTRLLIKSGAEVQVIMTSAACDFITPLTLSVLSKRPVLSEFSDRSTGTWNNHVELGCWADAMVIAPASARTLSRMVAGNAENLLTAVYLSARCPVFFAPAMDVDMYQHPAVQESILKLVGFGNRMIEPGEGELASGLIGAGRMAEPEEILDHLTAYFSGGMPLTGKRALVTAGPTYEAIDPVRFIGNHSSGKMGYALAEELARAGATVELVSGPTQLHPTHPNIALTRVQSAEEMHSACLEKFTSSDLTVLAAAVADYRPGTFTSEKIKKTGGNLLLELVPNPDIAMTLSGLRRPGQIVCGFALETNNGVEHAREKMNRKNFDLIVLNSLQDPGAGFGHDSNQVTIMDRLGNETKYGLKSKHAVAADIVRHIISFMHA